MLVIIACIINLKFVNFDVANMARILARNFVVSFSVIFVNN